METQFESGLVSIRPFVPQDAPALWEAVQESKAALTSWMVWCHADYALADCEAFITRCSQEWGQDKQYSFAIFGPDSRLLGSVGLTEVCRTHGWGNLGYWVRSREAGRGVGTEAVRLATRFAFDTLGLQRVEIVVPQGNLASARVAVKSGAKLEGLMRSRIILQGRARDALIYSLVPADIDLEALSAQLAVGARPAPVVPTTTPIPLPAYSFAATSSSGASPGA